MAVDPLIDLFWGQFTRWLSDGWLAVHPIGLDRVEPRRLDRQVTDPDLAPALALDAPVVRPDPAPHPLADMPGRVVPDQHEDLLAFGREHPAQPTQVVLGHLADGPPLD